MRQMRRDKDKIGASCKTRRFSPNAKANAVTTTGAATITKTGFLNIRCILEILSHKDIRICCKKKKWKSAQKKRLQRLSGSPPVSNDLLSPAVMS